MTDEPKAYFTRDGDLVRIQANPNFCAEWRKPLDIKIDTDGKFRGLSHETLWHAGAGILEISPKGKWKIAEISDTQDDDIYSFLSDEDDCIWGSFWDDYPSRRFAFIKNYETSASNFCIPADYEKYAIVNNHVAIKVGFYNRKPINQIFDCELGVWVKNANGVYNLTGGDDPDDAWDWPPKEDGNNIKWVIDRKSPGAPPRLNAQQRAALARAVEDGPVPYLDGVVRWRLSDLVAWLHAEHGVTVGTSTVSRILHEMGYRKLSARPRHHAQDPEAGAAFKKTSPVKSHKSATSFRPTHP